MEDKCPTCPKYGTGEFCDCGSSINSNEPFGCYTLMIVVIICFTLIMIFA